MDNYEEKYKAALGWMKGLYGGLHGVTKEEAEKYFPELKESNGERIKFLIKSCVYASNITPEGREEIFAWLEKQGNMLDADKVIEWIECKAFQGWAEEINIKQIVDKFKKDFEI